MKSERPSMESAVKILHIEDNEADSRMVRQVLRQAGVEAEFDLVESVADLEQALEQKRYDLILSDFSIPGMEPFESLRVARARCPEVPFIFVSGTIGEERAIETLKLGASDYVLKQRLSRLAPAVQRALEEAREHARRQQAEEELRQARNALARANAQLAEANAELERRVQERTAQLLEANANLQTFANTAAHDLRSPLRIIRNFAGMALEELGPGPGSECRAFMERVAQAAGIMERLMNDLLDYSRVEQAELRLEEVSLQKAAEEALALLEEEIREKHAAVSIEGPLPNVIGHAATVVLIINNYVANALKFVVPGVQPQVRIRAEVGDVERESVQASERGASEAGHAPRSTLYASHVRLWVEDNGIGISEEGAKKLFGAFQRLHAKGAYPGTGLGLAIVRRGAERMGGRVGVESQPGSGSRFWVQLPAAERDHALAEDKSRA